MNLADAMNEELNEILKFRPKVEAYACCVVDDNDVAIISYPFYYGKKGIAVIKERFPQMTIHRQVGRGRNRISIRLTKEDIRLLTLKHML